MASRIYFSLWVLIALAFAGSWRWLNQWGGAELRYWLGWSGFGIMCLTNLYVLRKNIPALKEVGRAARWLDFHIFCGMLGPTLVVFHTDFTVSGLVAVSFWSMVISACSGVVGRYFYTQLLQQRNQLNGTIKRYDEGFTKLETVVPDVYTPAVVADAKGEAVRMAFGGRNLAVVPSRLTTILYLSLIGDLRLWFEPLPLATGVSPAVGRKLKEYGLLKRRIALLDAYKRLMGYWHTFHVPFAIFMYVVAVIHIVAELLFRVPR